MSDAVVAEGSDSLGACTLDAGRVASLVGTSGRVWLYAEVSTGGGFVASDVAAVRVADRPELVLASQAVAAQPVTLPLASTTPSSDAVVVVAAQGASGEWPDGPRTQMPGDAVWSGILSPAWTTVPLEGAPTLDYGLHPFFEEVPISEQSAWAQGFSPDDGHSHFVELSEGGCTFRGLVAADGISEGTTVEYTMSPAPLDTLTEGGTYYLLVEASETTRNVGNAYHMVSIRTGDGSQLVPADPADSVVFDGHGYSGRTTVVPMTCVSGSASELFTLVLGYERGANQWWWDGGIPRINIRLSLFASERTTYAPFKTVYYTSVELPNGLDLWDGASYDVTVTTKDGETGLDSDPATAELVCSWAHQAPDPPDGVAVTPRDETDADGRRMLSAVVLLVAPEGAGDGDVCDVWRVTPDGPCLVAEGVSPSATVTDPWAPFGGDTLAYRVSMRTTDGDVSWRDYAYVLPCDSLRVDFGDEYVELPYDIAISDAFSKDFESRAHLDGTRSGYWSAGADRKASLSTDVVRVTEPEKAMALRRLARHDGPCLVRTPDGCAYEADVEVSLDSSHATSRLAVALDATEVSPSGEYMATVIEGE